jgi:hypothetical protein
VQTKTREIINDEPCRKKALYPKREEKGERFGYITLFQRWLVWDWGRTSEKGSKTQQ